MTFSATKSYLALITGIAIAGGLISDIDERCAVTSLDDGFNTPQNDAITWRHLLQQTSEWEGTLWGKPDLIDRHRQIGLNADNSKKGTSRTLNKPGSFWEYNDVRVNRLSLALLHVFKKPLATVLRERIMTPIGASDTWQWHPYRNSFVTIDGEALPSVPGGAHWGGGLFISSEDHARVAWLVRHRGRWQNRQLVPESWFDVMLAPCALNPIYGCLWWLNTDQQFMPSVSNNSNFMIGAGQHVVWVSEEQDLVCVLRWADGSKVDQILGAISAAA